MKKLIAIACCQLLLVLAACNGGGAGSKGSLGLTPNPPPVVNVSPGGFWGGTDSTGGDILMIVTETGQFHYITLDSFSQGTGILRVSNGERIAGDFKLVTPLGFFYPDRSTFANCTLSGTVAERQTLIADVRCTTGGGLLLAATVMLSYDAEYGRNSSLATIAGNYEGISAVLNVAGDGTIFSQNSATGCVINGQASIINSDFNAYRVLFSYSNCVGQSGILNDSLFFGTAILIDAAAPELLIVAATGEVAGVLVSNVLAVERT